MNNSKTWLVASSLTGGGNDNPEVPAIPNGETWMIKEFRAADINKGDGKSSAYVLRFGTEIMEFISLSGNTQTVNVEEEITGDGVKKLNVQRYNFSSFNKPCAFKITAYKRQ